MELFTLNCTDNNTGPLTIRVLAGAKLAQNFEAVNGLSETTTSTEHQKGEVLGWDDATPNAGCAPTGQRFIIFTMQSGFGMLESGAVSAKNEVNIMVKNSVDVIFGGLAYWAVGYGLSYGRYDGISGFVASGDFFTQSTDFHMGELFVKFVFQLSFATTATTIVSGAMAERTKLSAYILFSFLDTLIYAPTAHWVWDDRGFLRQLKAVDFAGSGVVHLMGGSSALCAAYMLGPRINRYEIKNKKKSIEQRRQSQGARVHDAVTDAAERELEDCGERTSETGDPINSIVGCFILWWGWIGFNCGSTFGISGDKWRIAAKVSCTTLIGSVAGGSVGILFSYYIKYKQTRWDVYDLVNSILGGLVSITAPASVIQPGESAIIGGIGAVLAVTTPNMFNKLHIDDPVGAIPVHGVCGFWGLISVGLFADASHSLGSSLGQTGLVHGGGFRLLGVQLLCGIVIITWSIVGTFAILWPIKQTIGLRVSTREELLGADYCEHHILPESGRQDLLIVDQAIGRFNAHHQLNGDADGDGDGDADGEVDGDGDGDSTSTSKSPARLHYIKGLQRVVSPNFHIAAQDLADDEAATPTEPELFQSRFQRLLRFIVRKRRANRQSFDLNHRNAGQTNGQISSSIETISNTNEPIF